MAIDFYDNRAGRSFRDLIGQVYFTGKSGKIVGEYWDTNMRVLYLAIADLRGVVTAHLFQDRGEETLGGIPMRGVSEYHESEEPPFANCPVSFMNLLSQPESPVAAGWRRMVLTNRVWLNDFIRATNGARPGDILVMTPPAGATGQGFSVMVGEDRHFTPIAESRWPGLARAVDQLASGYKLAVISKGLTG